MPTISTFVECDVHDSFRVQQVAGMFDLPAAETARETFTAEFPGLDEDWTIGAIVGPSGSGKSTLARHAFGDAVWRPGRWADDRAVIDGFGDRPIKEITHVLTAVGLSSPPSWVKPYRVLSGGEKFRCDLALALLGASRETREIQNALPVSPSLHPPLSACDSLIVFDEFTSVVDRTVARIGSAAVSRAIRSGRIRKRFVAVTCHYDVLEWLEADWYVDLADGRLHRRRLRRPEIRLAVVPCQRRLWKLFARHHYLSSALPAASACYAAWWNAPSSSSSVGRICNPSTTECNSVLQKTECNSVLREEAGPAPVAFCAVSPLMGAAGVRRISRVVVLPDYQGVGIGARLLDTVAAHHASRGHTVRITTSHPAMLAHLQRSPTWRAKYVYPNTRRRPRLVRGRRVKDAAGRCVATFEFAKER